MTLSMLKWGLIGTLALASVGKALQCSEATNTHSCAGADRSEEGGNCAWCTSHSPELASRCISCDDREVLSNSADYECTSYFPDFACGTNRLPDLGAMPPTPKDPAEAQCGFAKSRKDCSDVDTLATQNGLDGAHHCSWCISSANDEAVCTPCREVRTMEDKRFVCHSFSTSMCRVAALEAYAARQREGKKAAGGVCAEAHTSQKCGEADSIGKDAVAKRGLTGEAASNVRCAWCSNPSRVDAACVPCALHDEHIEQGYECFGYGKVHPCARSEEQQREAESPFLKDHTDHHSQPSMSIGSQVLQPSEPVNPGNGRVENYQSSIQRPYTTTPLPGLREDVADPKRVGGSPLPASPKYSCAVNTVFVREQPLPGLDKGAPDDLRAQQHVTNGIAGHLTEFEDYLSRSNTLFPHVSTTVKFGSPVRVPFRDLTQHFFSCIDGRADYAVMGTPGGDIGEFLLAMNIMERAREAHQTPMSFEEVLDWFQQYLEDMAEAGRFHLYMGTDARSMKRWGSAARAANPIQPRGFEERERLIAMSTEPAHVGNVFLRAALERPEDFMVRRKLTEHVIRAYLTVYYDVSHPMRTKLLFVALAGTHNETAVVHVDRSSGYPCGSAAPLVVPRVRGESVLVHHRGAVDLYRAEFASWVASKIGLEGQEEVLLKTMRGIARKQLTETLTEFKRLGSTVTEFNAFFSSDDAAMPLET